MCVVVGGGRCVGVSLGVAVGMGVGGGRECWHHMRKLDRDPNCRAAKSTLLLHILSSVLKDKSSHCLQALMHYVLHCIS